MATTSLKIPFVLASLFLCASIEAKDFWFTPDTSSYPVWRNDLWQSWSVSEDGGETFQPPSAANGAPSPLDNVHIDYTKEGANATGIFQMQGDVTVNNLTWQGFNTDSGNWYMKTVDSATAISTTLTVLGNFYEIHDVGSGWTNSSMRSGTNNTLNLVIGGNVEFSTKAGVGGSNLFYFGTGGASALGSLKVNGNFINTGSSQIGLNMQNIHDQARIDADPYYYYKNADVQIGGYISTNNNNGMIFLNDAMKTETYISVNGLNGLCELRTQNNNLGVAGANTTLILKNDKNYTSTGGITDYFGYGADEGIKAPEGKLKVVMMGTARQTMLISSAKRAYRGGTDIISGELIMSTAYYNGVGTWGDINMIGNSDGISAKFGAIGSTGNYDTSAKVYANNLIWSNGTIVVGIANATYASQIILDGTMQKGAGAGSEFWFGFVGNTEFLFADNAWFKIVSWTLGNKATDFTSDDFKAIAQNGKEAVFEIRDDGLYVSYQIPEPATFAAIFGVLALAIAARRRRK